jgi:hypothetical protein
MNKKEVKSIYQENYFGDFDIELIDNTVVVHTDLPLSVEIKYNNANEKEYIYECLAKLATCFDFSYTLEFENKNDLASFVS